jgi:integrase
MGHAAAAGIAT